MKAKALIVTLFVSLIAIACIGLLVTIITRRWMVGSFTTALTVAFVLFCVLLASGKWHLVSNFFESITCTLCTKNVVQDNSLVSGRAAARADASKNNILVITYDNRPEEDYIIEGRQINSAYCAKHGYTYKYLSSVPYENDMPPYWTKVKIVQDELEKGTYDFVMWMDSDAVFSKHQYRLEQFLEDNIDAAMSGDMFDKFNAGVFIFRNSDKGRTLIDEWMAMYNSSSWSRDRNGKWSCSGRWAGIEYEQGAFCSLAHRRRDVYAIQRLNLCVADNILFQRDITSSKNFIVHLWGEPSKLRHQQFTLLKNRINL